MGQHSAFKDKKTDPVAVSGDRVLNPILIIRLAAASVVFAASLVLRLPDLVSVLLLVAVAVVSGYDLVVSAVDRVRAGDYFCPSLIVIVTAVLAFVIGFAKEAAAMVILYRIWQITADYVSDRTKKSAQELMQFWDAEDVARTKAAASERGADRTALGDAIRSAATFVLKLLMVFSVLFALIVPLVTNISFKDSIHRALMILLASTPVSVVVSLPLVSYVSFFQCSQMGVLFGKASAMEKLAAVKNAIFDKAGVFTEGCPKLVSLQSDILDADTFMNFVAHAVYYSDQPIAKAVESETNGEYRLELISNFEDIPGSGVDLEIGGAHVTLATRELFISRGEAVPYEDVPNDQQIFYMMISDKYVGKVVLSNALIRSSVALVTDCKAQGIEQCFLLTENGKEETEQFAQKLGFDNFFGELDTEKKLNLIEDMTHDLGTGTMYVYSTGIETHSSASLDVRVGKKGNYADVLLNPETMANFPDAIHVCKRMKEIIAENAIFAFLIKAILIFLCINGWSNLWFVVLLDGAAALGTMLNSIRVTSESLLKDFPVFSKIIDD